MRMNFVLWVTVWLAAVISGSMFWGFSWIGLTGATIALVWVLWPKKKPVSGWDNPNKSAISKHVDER